MKSINSSRKNTDHQDLEFIEMMRGALEPKIGKNRLLELVLTELNVFYYSIFVWFKKPKVEVGKTFTYYKSSQIKTIVIVFSILIVGEGVLFHYLIQRWNEVIAWIFTVLNVYGFLYLIGLYHSVKYLPHVIRDGKLIIRLGFQGSIEVEIDNIEHITKAKELDLGVKAPKDTYYSLLQIDSPQYEITLREPIEMKASYGIKKNVSKVVFRADEPTKMIEEITSNLVRFQDDRDIIN
ncbi:hypothetical protein JOC85_001126 [Bacillus mesophilus]|uniref:Uncharacterized protein n=1 Tax=Bacillus mesophilus TaxID=1808955 RepID=A0A6M0Q7I4_9BACI|nr:hypothetical protein [Bacillus mesophilus]MBM7660359.1 hypothetical protein [Bacillus mesophilus]NEY71068.1 hypothetical protein [Bacillus mesophilus]